jgi:hypothetical protein
MARKSVPAPVSPPFDEARAALFELIARSAEPIDAKKLTKGISVEHRMTDADLRETLERGVREGRLFAYPPKTAAGGERFWDRDVRRMVRDELLLDLARLESPLAAAQVAKGLKLPLKVSEADAATVLESLVEAGSLHRHPAATAAGRPRYATRSVEAFRRAALLSAVARTGPLAETKLKGLVKGISFDDFRALLDALLRERQLFAHPPVGRTGKVLFGGRPPAPEAYLTEVETVLGRAVSRLRECGVDADELRRAVVGVVERAGVSFGGARGGSSSTERVSVAESLPDLIDILRELDPAADRGGLVATRDLRRGAERKQGARIDKRAFDAAVLSLSREGRLSLHRHDHASGLSETERDELVTDGAGNYYVGVAIRRPTGT